MTLAQELQSQGALCSLCGQSFNSQNTAKVIPLAKDIYEPGKITQKFAAICSQGPYNERQEHLAGEPKSLLYSYSKTEGIPGFRTTIL